ncbi:hypothetical protein [Pseudomonas putida]|uniref:Uncharacterized protein n=1 Tax=Pseudomonas putida TaxID=303 RepID=A0A6S5TKA9_PSEPU|nr:hypothetical protein [Pseudomonas putida]BBT40930.1 hypothetical protein WP8W18C01_32710 [Pseudomonas putida]
MPTENRSSNTEMVSVPREWLNSVALLQMPLDQLQEQAVEFLCEPCDEPAEQHQGEPVYQLRNTVVGNVWRDADKEAYDSAASLVEYERRVLYAHAAPGEVERLTRKAANADLALATQTRQVHSLRAQLGERDALLRERFGEVRKLAERACGRPKDSPEYRLLVEAVSPTMLLDLTALSASVEPSAPKCRKCGDPCTHDDDGHDECRFCTAGVPSNPNDASAPVERDDPVREALRAFVGAAYPVANQINERGHNWSEPYLDEALALARAALGSKPS